MEIPLPAPRSPLTYRKLFHWGLVFWLLVWLGSVCVLETIHLGAKGGGWGAVRIGDGAISVSLDILRVSGPQSAHWRHEVIWSQESLALIREYPEILIAKLGTRGWQVVRVSKSISFPFVGFLFLWLVAGLYGEIKLLRHPATLLDGSPAGLMRSRKRVGAICGAIFGLMAFVCIADHKAREADIAKCCAAQIHILIREAVDKKEGEPLSWVSSPKYPPLQKNCPAGGLYLLSPVKPPKDKPAAQCPRGDHRRFYAGLAGYFHIADTE